MSSMALLNLTLRIGVANRFGFSVSALVNGLEMCAMKALCTALKICEKSQALSAEPEI